MYKVTIRMTRPSIDVPWFEPSNVMKNTMIEHRANGNLISESAFLQDDGLTKIYIAVWKDKETYEKFIFDDELAYERHQRRIYNTKYQCNIKVIKTENIEL